MNERLIPNICIDGKPYVPAQALNQVVHRTRMFQRMHKALVKVNGQLAERRAKIATSHPLTTEYGAAHSRYQQLADAAIKLQRYSMEFMK